MQKYGRPNESTPQTWKKAYTDFNAPAESDLRVIEADDDVEKPITSDVGRIDVEMTTPGDDGSDDEKEDSGDKKKKRKTGETEEERAERKKKKKEKKEKKEKRDKRDE